MKFTISAEVIEAFPELVLGVLVSEKIDNHGKDEGILTLLKAQESAAHLEIRLEALAQDPLISNWRKAYKQLGVDKERPSHEALVRRVAKGEQIRHINKLVDLYNYLSLKYKTPFGGEDLEKVEGNIYLKRANGDETFVQLGSSEETRPEKGEIIYVDDKKVLCRRWNWRESDITKLTEDTTKAILVTETLPPFAKTNLNAALSEFESLLSKFCKAKTKAFILDKDNNEISW